MDYQELLPAASEKRAERAKYRVLNCWDNIDGTVERGYAGRSLFFDGGRVAFDARRIEMLAAYLGAIGINVIAFNNVNVTPAAARLITPEHLPDIAKLADIFRRFGIRVALSVDFAAPQTVGGLDTSDPLDSRVSEFWENAAARIYGHIPDFAGVLVKADSEFRAGPAALGRTQADGANAIARAIAPRGGIVWWRCFVYDCNQDWRDTRTDRPKAAYEHFMPLDGKFDANVRLQIKNGPSDFQVREPLSPLLCSLKNTPMALELQITQEYTGQQIDLFGLACQWEDAFNSPVGGGRKLRDLIGGEIDTVAAVANLGDGYFWTGNPLAQANLFAFGRQACDPTRSAREIYAEWARTYTPDRAETVTDMLLKSRGIYEKYTTPLGLNWFVNTGHHYGPSPEGYEFMKWGAYHRADHIAVGVDRTKNGTAFTEQYPRDLAEIYGDAEKCPEELLLYFHRLPYTYRLKSGKTLIQHIYDTHFEGVEETEQMIAEWQKTARGGIYDEVSSRLTRQLENAREWRDVVNTYFYRKTGIGDEKGRKIYD